MRITTESFLTWLSTTGLRIGVIIAVTLLSLAAVRLLIVRSKRRLGPPEKMGIERAKRTETLAKTVENVLSIAIVLAAILMILRQAGIEIGPLLAGAGIVGLAVSFGAQNLVKDVINGFFILLENNMNVGDVVQVAGKSGTVERIALRTTVLRDLEGNVHAVPNSEILTITNMTKEWSRAVLEIGVAYREDIDAMIDVLRGIGEGLARDPVFGPLIVEPMEILGVESFGDSSVNIKLMFKTRPVKQWQVAREFRRRVKKTFDEKGIRLPYPHRMIYFGDVGGSGRTKIEIGS
jgi:moderate conductance mechanosensitive channel